LTDLTGRDNVSLLHCGLSFLSRWRKLLGRQIWIAEIGSRGNAFATYTDLADSAARTAVQRLKKDGLI
jgi:hypothetical protein